MKTSIPRDQLLESLREQSLEIPDLRPLFQHWPQAVNPHLERLKSVIPSKLASVYNSSSKLATLNRADFGLFGASYWPNANFESLQILTSVAIWLFIWDDEVNDEVGDSEADVERAQTMRDDTVRYLKACLGVSSALAIKSGEDEIGRVTSNQRPSWPLLSFFKPIEEQVQKRYTNEQRELLLRELELYIKTSHLEQKRRQSPQLPSLLEYTACRRGSSAVGVILAFDEYAQDIRLPAAMMDEPLMSAIWKETNTIIWVVNDLLSLKKELERATVDSLVPILYQESGSLHDAVVESVKAIEKSIKRFDDAAEKLAKKHDQDSQLTQNLQAYIRACRYNCTGNLHWSLHTGRYGVAGMNAEGSIDVQLWT